MVKRKLGIISIFLCLFLCFMPCHTYGASTSDMAESVDTDRECRLTVAYAYNGTPFANTTVRLYKIADVSSNYNYTATPSFEGLGLVLNGLRTVGEWNVIRSTLEAYIISHSLEADNSQVTNQNGEACFESLQTGLYLALLDQPIQDDTRFVFDSALISLPDIDEGGYLRYEVDAVAKCEAMPPIEPDEGSQLKVIKLWKGDEGRPDRPKSIEVEIFRDGTIYETVVLSESNNWSYAWEIMDDGSNWTVYEKNIPSGYTMTLEKRGASFVLTNTRTENDPDAPKSPQTGDTSNIWLYIILMTISGCLLIALGITGKRRIYEKAN